jgi:Txe/YoeB family toxin of toxin-antitoxin system
MPGGQWMMDRPWRIVYTHDALKDKKSAYEAGFDVRIDRLLDILRQDPFASYPPYEKLIGDLTGAYSRRINRQHRLVYSVHREERTIKILSMWQHYE